MGNFPEEFKQNDVDTRIRLLLTEQFAASRLMPNPNLLTVGVSPGDRVRSSGEIPVEIAGVKAQFSYRVVSIEGLSDGQTAMIF